MNADQGTTNDLLYIPRDANDVIVANGTFDQLMTFINAGDCDDLSPGTIVERNTCRAPWTNTLDVHFDVGVPVGRYSGEIAFDVQNLINLIDSDNGLVRYATFNGIAPASAVLDPATGVWRYTLNTVVTNPALDRFSRDDLRSRWQAQLGFRLRF